MHIFSFNENQKPYVYPILKIVISVALTVIVFFVRFHFLIETDKFRQFWHKKCAADKEKTLSHSSTFTRCIPKTAQAKGLFETEI